MAWFYSSSYGDSFNLSEPVDKADMLVFRWPSISDPHAGGDSPLKSAIRQLQQSGKWADLQDWILNNRARPDYAFVAKEGVGPAAAQRTAKAINDKLRGAGNGQVAIIEDAGQLVPLNWTPTDLAPLKFNEALQDALMFSLKTPKSFITNDSNRATMDASLEQWARQGKAPIVAVVESVLNAEAKIECDADDLIWVFENVIPEDRTQELAEEQFELTKWTAAIQSPETIVTPEEFRQNVLGLSEPLPEPEPEPTPPSPIIVAAPLNQQVTGQPAEQDAQAAEDVAQDQPAKSFDLVGLNVKVSRGLIDRATAINLVAHVLQIGQEQAKTLVTHPKRHRTKARKQLPPVKIMASAVKMLTDQVIRCMDRQKSHYMNQLTGNHPAKEMEANGVTSKQIEPDGMTSKALDLPSSFKRLDEWDEEDAQLYKPYLHMQAASTAEARTDAFVGIGAQQDVFSVVPEHVNEAVQKSTLKFAKSTNDTTEKNLNVALDELRENIKAGVEQGDPIPLMRKRVEDVFENISKDRAELIARTETSRAAHEAQRITAKASGCVKGFKLLASSECCDICADMADKEVGLDEKFDPDDDYDDSILPIHCNCRCSMLEMLDMDALNE